MDTIFQFVILQSASLESGPALELMRMTELLNEVKFSGTTIGLVKVRVIRPVLLIFLIVTFYDVETLSVIIFYFSLFELASLLIILLASKVSFDVLLLDEVALLVVLA